jgi:hypothetical protein
MYLSKKFSVNAKDQVPFIEAFDLFYKVFRTILIFSENIKKFVEYLINFIASLNYIDKPCYSKIHLKINQTLQDCGFSEEDDFSLIIDTKNVRKIKAK